MLNNVKRDIRKGFLINFITKYSSIFFQIIIGMILARLLVPEEYGIVAIVFILITFFSILGQIGMGPAVIQNDLNLNEVFTVFLFSMFIGLVFSIVFFFSGDLIAKIYDNNAYVKISKLLSITIFFNISVMVPGALLRKRKEFIKIGVIEFLINITGGLFSIFFAYNGFSYYSLIYSSIISSILMLILKLIFSNIKFTRRIEYSGIKRISSYSFFQFLSNTLNYFSVNFDNLLIGRFLGDANLGIYDKAYKLMRYPVTSLVYVITPVLHPVLAKYQDNTDFIYDITKTLSSKIAFLSIPLSFFFFFSSNEIISIMYGDNWIAAAGVLKALSASLWINVSITLYVPIFQSLNKTNLLFFCNLISSFFIVVSVVIGILIFNDLIKISWIITFSFYIIFYINYYILIVHIFNKKIFNYLKIFIKPLIIGFVIGLFLFLTDNIDINNVFLSLFAKILISCIVYFLYFKFFEKKELKSVFKFS